MSQSLPPTHQAESRAESAAPEGLTPGLSLEALVLAHHAAVYRYAYRLTGTAVDAEDLTQQTFLIAQQKLQQLRDDQRAAGWLFSIARTSYLKSLAKRFPASCDGDMAQTPAPTPEIVDIDSEELQRSLADLPAELRLTIVMFYFEELSYKEIAEEQNVAIGTVMSRLSRAKQRLRERLGTHLPIQLASSTQSAPQADFPVASRSIHSTR